MTKKRKRSGVTNAAEVSTSTTVSQSASDPYALPMKKAVKKVKIQKSEDESTSVLPGNIKVDSVESNAVISEELVVSDSEELSEHEDDISDADLYRTLYTLSKLSKASPNVLKSKKRYKELRRVLFELGIFQKGAVASVPNLSGPSTTLVPTVASIDSLIEHRSWKLALESLNALQMKPKLGTLQRWVRAIDAAGCINSTAGSTVNKDNSENGLVLDVLCAVLRRCGSSEVTENLTLQNVLQTVSELSGKHFSRSETRSMENYFRNCASSDGKFDKLSVVEVPEFCGTIDGSKPWRDSNNPSSASSLDYLRVDPVTGIRSIKFNNTDSQEKIILPKFRICHEEKGSERKPENKYDLQIVHDVVGSRETGPGYDFLFRFNDKHSKESSESLRIPGKSRIKKFPIPHVPGAFLLQDVLSLDECDRFIAMAEHNDKYQPDEPINGQPGDSTLAHACVWMVSSGIEREVFSRVQQFLPSKAEVMSEEKVSDSKSDSDNLAVCLNRRWRFYRYVPGRYYRPHIDGAWPRSGFSDHKIEAYMDHFTSDLGEYYEQGREEKYGIPADHHKLLRFRDASDNNKYQSQLTFLIYLNDDFEGGWTKYFLPGKVNESDSEENYKLFSFPVRPQKGSILVFPHGNCPNALLHEGSPVTKRCKYVVRTEVIYNL